MIETLSLRNFRILRKVDVELRPFTLLVGPNASGKSTLLEALDFLFGCLLDPHLGRESSSYLSRRAHGPISIQACARFKSGQIKVRWRSGRISQLTKEDGLPPPVIGALRPQMRLSLD